GGLPEMANPTEPSAVHWRGYVDLLRRPGQAGDQDLAQRHIDRTLAQERGEPGSVDCLRRLVHGLAPSLSESLLTLGTLMGPSDKVGSRLSINNSIKAAQ